MMKVNLLPCPFCNDDTYYPRVMKNGDTGYYYVECGYCGFRVMKNGDTGYYYVECGYCGIESPDSKNEQVVINYWNTRPELIPTQEYIRGFNECKRQLIEMANNLPDLKESE